MDRLELPNLARRLPDQLHTSSDGQKFEVRIDVGLRREPPVGRKYDFSDEKLNIENCVVQNAPAHSSYS
jgi:hypothetical protein